LDGDNVNIDISSARIMANYLFANVEESQKPFHSVPFNFCLGNPKKPQEYVNRVEGTIRDLVAQNIHRLFVIFSSHSDPDRGDIWYCNGFGDEPFRVR
jgi:hypothetical protein